MKKTIIAIIISILLIFVLCGWKRVDRENMDAFTVVGTYRDEETGVEYVVFKAGYGAGVCPRYNADGTLYTSGEE